MVWSAVGQCTLGKGPDALVWVQFGRIGGEELQVEAGERVAQLLNGRAFVDAAVVPQHDDGAAQMAKQLAEKSADVGPADVRELQAVVQAEAAAARAHRDSGNDRDLVAPLPDAQNRGLAARGPRLADAGNQQEPRFVDEDEVGPQPCSVFFTRGQSRRIHCSIRASSRSKARDSGF